MKHMHYLRIVASRDVSALEEKEKTYKGSWKKRGGVGAFMMLARKWDRLEVIAQEAKYDIFGACLADLSGKDGSALAEIRDLRRYLTLVEAEIMGLTNETPREDSNKHATDPALYAREHVEEPEIPANNSGTFHGLNRS